MHTHASPPSKLCIFFHHCTVLIAGDGDCVFQATLKSGADYCTAEGERCDAFVLKQGGVAANVGCMRAIGVGLLSTCPGYALQPPHDLAELLAAATDSCPSFPPTSLPYIQASQLTQTSTLATPAQSTATLCVVLSTRC